MVAVRGRPVQKGAETDVDNLTFEVSEKVALILR